MSSDSAHDHHPRWICSSDTKQVIKTLVEYYSHRIKSKNIDLDSAMMWAGVEFPQPVLARATDEDSGEALPTNSTLTVE